MDRSTRHEGAAAIVDQPMVSDRRHRGIVADPEVFAAEIDCGIGEHVAIGRSNRPTRNCGVGSPCAVGVLFTFPADDAFRVARHRIIFGNVRRAIVVIVVGVGDIGAVAVIDFDLKPVALDPRVVDGVEIIDAAVSDTGCGPVHRKNADKSGDQHPCESEKLVHDLLFLMP